MGGRKQATGDRRQAMGESQRGGLVSGGVGGYPRWMLRQSILLVIALAAMACGSSDSDSDNGMPPDVDAGAGGQEGDGAAGE